MNERQCIRRRALWACLVASSVCAASVAQVTPLQVTGQLTGSAGVEAGEQQDIKPFDVPVSVFEPVDLTSHDFGRNELASLSVDGQDHLANQWCRVNGSSQTGSVSGESFAFAYHAGPASGATRNAQGEARATTRVQWAGGGYRLHGHVGALFSPNIPPEQMRRYGHVRLTGPSGLVHEFHGFDLTTFTGGAFDATGVLPAGEYEIEASAMSRAQSGVTMSMDPMIASVTWTLEGVTVCNDIDFNNDELFPDASDIDAFLAVFSGGACPTNSCDSIDFNNDGLYPDSTDIDSFLSVFSGGAC
jgi:hypothetical protein